MTLVIIALGGGLYFAVVSSLPLTVGQLEGARRVISAVVAIVVAGLTAGSPRRQDAASRVGFVVTLAPAAALAVYSGTGAVVPSTPAGTAAPGCHNVQLRGADLLAQTFRDGANVRSGPGRDYPQVDRLPGGCAVGLSGYCIGEPVADLVYRGRRDARWFVVHPRGDVTPDAFLSAGAATALEPEGRAGPLQKDCPPVARIKIGPVIAVREGSDLSLSVTGSQAPTVGYAISLPEGSQRFDLIRPLQTSINGANNYLITDDSDLLAAVPSGKLAAVRIAAAPCLGVGVPHHDLDLIQVVTVAEDDFGALVTKVSRPLRDEMRQQLAYAACQEVDTFLTADQP